MVGINSGLLCLCDKPFTIIPVVSDGWQPSEINLLALLEVETSG